MIDIIFTIDYEIYGNGEGSLKDHILEPTRELKKIFDQAGVKLVFFVEAAELEKIEEAKSDPEITNVKKQTRDLYCDGHEIALHLHPQWYNGKYQGGTWLLDNSEYNLCVLPEERIAQMVDQSINYLRSILNESDYAPLSFRAGNWLFQPTQPAAKILNNRGVKIDSSVFKGGLQHQNKLDYRKTLKNGYYWNFSDDVNKPFRAGNMVEIPIYSEMVPPWRMATKKRISIQQQSTKHRSSFTNKMYRYLDMARLRQPLKFDFCRMTMEELTAMMDKIVENDKNCPNIYKPIVAIGHTKDLIDFGTVSYFLSYLNKIGVEITTFQRVYNMLRQQNETQKAKKIC